MDRHKPVLINANSDDLGSIVQGQYRRLLRLRLHRLYPFLLLLLYWMLLTLPFPFRDPQCQSGNDNRYEGQRQCNLQPSIHSLLGECAVARPSAILVLIFDDVGAEKRLSEYSIQLAHFRWWKGNWLLTDTNVAGRYTKVTIVMIRITIASFSMFELSLSILSVAWF